MSLLERVRLRRERIARSLRWRPEWRAAVIVASAWVALGAGLWSHHLLSGETGVRAAHTHPSHHHAGHAPSLNVGSEGVASGVVGALPAWALMSLAMMGPATLPAVRHVGLNSIRRRRQWAMSFYVAVYLAVWVAFGFVALVGVHYAQRTLGVDSRVLLALLLAAAAGWQLTRWKRRALYACARTVPLPPSGRRADAGCARLRPAPRRAWRQIVLGTDGADGGHRAFGFRLDGGLTVFVVIEERTLLGRRLLTSSAITLALVAGIVALVS